MFVGFIGVHRRFLTALALSGSLAIYGGHWSQVDSHNNIFRYVKPDWKYCMSAAGCHRPPHGCLPRGGWRWAPCPAATLFTPMANIPPRIRSGMMGSTAERSCAGRALTRRGPPGATKARPDSV